jgi:hypothetical protein
VAIENVSGGRPLTLHPLIPQIQIHRRSGDKDEPVMREGGHAAFKGGLRTAARRLQADPP